MKKKILVVAALQLFLMLGACSSDSGSDSTTPEVKGEIKADYVVDETSGKDFVIDNNNLVYRIGESGDYAALKKIDLEGKVTTLVESTNLYNFLDSELVISNQNEILTLTINISDTDKIFRFENNFSEVNPFYTMKAVSSPFAKKARLTSICNNNDNTYFVFDYNAKQIKRILPALGTDVFVAGSEKNEITDGTGLSAGFSEITKIISNNNILYLIDNKYDAASNAYLNFTIRKLEYVNNEWKVSTLISNTVNQYKDIAFDANNDLYVLVGSKGIFKLNLQDNSLVSFKEGDIKILNKKQHTSITLGSFNMMKIKGNDLYIASKGRLIKISDFQTKFANAAK